MKMTSGGGKLRFQKPLKGNFLRQQMGAAAVEFAAVAPVFLGLLYGLLELARALFTQGLLLYAVQEGSRFAATHSASTSTEIETLIRRNFVGIDPAPALVTVTPTPNPDGTRTVTVTIRYRFTWLLNVFGIAPVILEAESTSLAG